MGHFRITQKHYDTIIKQGYKNLPYESGGFLGGKDGLITAIMPIYNKHWVDEIKTDNFVFFDDDILRAKLFFQKHDLDYYGLYHTHPVGVAYPSQADIDSGQQFHFIISYRDQKKPDLAAFQVHQGKVTQLQIKVVSNQGFTSLSEKDERPVIKTIHKDPDSEREALNEKIGGMISDDEDKKKYQELDPRPDIDSSFSTLA